MAVPQVVIVGRPNVGKSSLLNWLAGKRIAIVDPTSGVTRDRVTHLWEIEDRYVELVDTGGMGVKDCDNLTEHIEEQIQTAIDSADLILFVLDTQQGLSPLDQEVSRRLCRLQTPVLCVANKTDSEHLAPQAAEFHRLGHPVIQISVKANRGKSELCEALVAQLPPASAENEPPPEALMKLALVGRRNTGKSTLINTLVHTQRMIVSEVPGTTRDSVDVRFELDGKAFMAIDTPGFRRRKSVVTDIDFYGTHRAERSIRRADVVLLFFDAAEPISKVDKQLCEYIAEQYKPCMFVVNKWDLYAGQTPTEKWANYLRKTFPTMAYVPIAFITGQAGKNVKTMLNHAQMLFKQSRNRTTTPALNKLLRAALEHNPPPTHRNHRPKIYYAAQVAEQPPTLVLFCNNPDAVAPAYRQYLLGVFRERLPFGEVPIKLYLRRRAQSDSRSEVDAKLK
jgi:GTPase